MKTRHNLVKQLLSHKVITLNFSRSEYIILDNLPKRLKRTLIKSHQSEWDVKIHSSGHPIFVIKDSEKGSMAKSKTAE